MSSSHTLRRPVRAPQRLELIYGAVALVTTLVITGYRMGFASKAVYPGHADPAFFYGVAQNIHAGKGQTVDYVWHFLVPQDHVRHYAFDYWLPMPSWLMSLGLLTGNGLTGAIDVGILLSLLLPISAYAMIRELTRSAWAPALGAVIVIIQPGVSYYAMQAESAIYFAALGVTAVAAAVYARRITWMWVVTGAFTALAAMSRSEGLLLTAAIVISALLWTQRSRWYRRIGLWLLGYLPFMAYFFFQNLKHFGGFFPPASSAFPFMTTYEEIFATHIRKTLGTLIGGKGVSGFFSSRLASFAQLPGILLGDITATSLILMILFIGVLLGRAHSVSAAPRTAVSPMHTESAPQAVSPIQAESAPEALTPTADDSRRRFYTSWIERYQRPPVQRFVQSFWLLPVLFTLFLLLLEGELAPLVKGGAAMKSFVALTALIVVTAVVGIARVRPHWLITALVAAVLIVGPLATVRRQTHLAVHNSNAAGQAAYALLPTLQHEQKCLNRPVVLMTRSPWEITQTTGFATVQMPAGSLDDIMTIVRKFGVTDILNPALRPALSDIKELTAPNGLLEKTQVSTKSFYRIRETTPGARC